MDKRIFEEYDKQLNKVFSNKLKGKTTEEIANTSVDEVIEDIENSQQFDQSKNRMNEVLEKTHLKIIQNKAKTVAKKDNDNSKQDVQGSIEHISTLDKISISILQRIFCISFPKAVGIIDEMLEKQVIKKLDKGYAVIDNEGVKSVLTNKLWK